ncbi:hypothetical protein BDDG_12305 [Blastomyces dermatitidis ATCC 18188]|uniref:Uncharacterized protein n=1 Tax=Ajellomyces dermatitidis (strain ATCC 18188 / CBS 674.68) TaxID=653446 RepID=A0A0J9ENZ7_AJEDA|nr:hypothetical protein BDDG_12305 [Blastomyces dermatitidis ATCC 18188]
MFMEKQVDRFSRFLCLKSFSFFFLFARFFSVTVSPSLIAGSLIASDTAVDRISPSNQPLRQARQRTSFRNRAQEAGTGMASYIYPQPEDRVGRAGGDWAFALRAVAHFPRFCFEIRATSREGKKNNGCEDNDTWQLEPCQIKSDQRKKRKNFLSTEVRSEICIARISQPYNRVQQKSK